jgi:hypothetical protein
MLIYTLIVHGVLVILGKYSERIKEKTKEAFRYGVYYEMFMSTYLEIIFYTVV